MEARYNAIPSYYASNVLQVFQQLSSSSSSDTDVLVGAITDGNSDPRNIPELQAYFDFCINAESVGVSKPDTRVYQKAIEYVVAHPFLQDFLSRSTEDVAVELEDQVGPW